MRRFFRLYQIEQKLFFRGGDVFIFNLCMPVAAMLMIGFIGGNQQAGISGMTYLQSAFASVTAVGICCSAFMSIPIVLVDYRDKKILKHIYCSPCSPARIMAVNVLCSGVMAVLSAILVGVTACLVFGYRMEGNAAAFCGVWFLTMIAMFSIGLLVAALCKTVKTMNVATTVLYFPMLFLSGATIPCELFPEQLQAVAGVLPLGVGIRLMKSASMGTMQSESLWQAVILLVITAVCGLTAVGTFRWE